MEAEAKTNTSKNPNSSDVSVTIPVTSYRGYFYNAEGEFLSHEGKSEQVFLAEKYEKKADNIRYLEVTDLNISHDDFCYITGVIMAENSLTFEAAAATTQATFNAVKHVNQNKSLTMSEQAVVAKERLESQYSSVEIKTALKDTEKTNQSKNARKGLFHVLQGKEDYSRGAVRWDGIDFADKGVGHRKAIDDGISITKELWTEFIDSCAYDEDENGVIKLKRGKTPKELVKCKTKEEAFATIPFLSIPMNLVLFSNSKFSIPDNSSSLFERNVFIEKRIESQLQRAQEEAEIKKKYPHTYVVTEGLYECLGQGRYNKGRVLNKALVVYDGHIFWGMYKDHPQNKGYYWKAFFNWK